MVATAETQRMGAVPKLKRLLIANRGEIACRVIKTARRLGLETVAVYSEADSNAGHVMMADIAMPIGPASASESYLNSEAIITAALESGADAIHPGYGFLSENADFARATTEAGLTFVGPNITAIDIMGDKARAKQHLADHDVPLIPGYDDADQNTATLRHRAEKIGLPVMIKAAAGGGGKGMRLVHDMADFEEAVELARSEALKSFANDQLILEKALIGARHVEVQVFGDQQGNLVHLFERDCSVQRRHQKIIEEAPAYGLSAGARSRLYQAAINVAQSVDYHGAGTVEFLMMPDESFYFLEMNTRLQVEHPVTEMITGLDLVEWQLTVADGQALPLSQDQITMSGHAIEVRLCAEDPENGFMPTTGALQVDQLDDVLVPLGGRCRVDDPFDDALDAYVEISPFYDPMIAKLIASGDDRHDAIDALIGLLESYRPMGVITNRDFLLSIALRDDFAETAPTTDYLGDIFELDAISLEVPDSSLAGLAVAFEAEKRAQDQATHASDTQVHGELAFWSNDGPLWSRVGLGDYGDAMVSLDHGSDGLLVKLADAPVISTSGQENGPTSLLVTDNRFWCADNNRILSIPLTQGDAAASAKGSGQITAPMHGTLIDIHVKVGDAVEVEQPIATLEAMKMQHKIRADLAGVVEDIPAELGKTIGADELIAAIKPTNSQAGDA